ncbi:s-adenosylmethionine mitochondrial carrier protein [Nannochloropsis gaditana]|uniref:S-adenosylmethionine mitochondrial carrier protein n=1 Tax=Nannochloropsis gaditana TaxID=72520 RepID=W7THW6_9STRA|nr:s-adenosylmethionine mitochondrial carrier protein [Nannochloropsis gaditana]
MVAVMASGRPVSYSPPPLPFKPRRCPHLLFLLAFILASSWITAAGATWSGIRHVSQRLSTNVVDLAPRAALSNGKSDASKVNRASTSRTPKTETAAIVPTESLTKLQSFFRQRNQRTEGIVPGKATGVPRVTLASQATSTCSSPARRRNHPRPSLPPSPSFSSPLVALAATISAPFRPRKGRAAAAATGSRWSPSSAPPSSFAFSSFLPTLPALHVNKTLTFWGNMLAGAVSRSCAQTAMHPANVVKTLLQTKGAGELANLNVQILTRGAGAQFALSLPHGALAFAVLEATKSTLSSWFPVNFAGPAFDFVSSAVSTTICSVISTPQMVLTDRIMAGYYPNLVHGVRTVLKTDGVQGLYAGWFAALAQKIPSYGLTWVFFQQLKIARNRWMDHEATNGENFGMGALAAAATVCVMIPLDTVKTRIVTQAANPAAGVHYKGVWDCFSRVLKEEGLKTFYAPLAPRLVSVVPMIGIQFGVYEFMKRTIAGMPEKGPREERREGGGWDAVKAWGRRKVPSLAPESDSPLSQPPLSEIFDEIEDAN